jgi:AsmA protein
MRVVKILLGIVAAIVVLLVAAVVIVASTFDPNEYKDVATDAFTARTGRTLAIDEDLRLAYFPWLAVETGGVTVGNAAGFGTQPFATVRRVAARVKLVPLLSRRVEIGTVELDGLALNLARDANLRGNWEDFLAATSNRDEPTPQPSTEPGGVSIDSLAIEGVRVTDGNVHWHENTSELRYSVTGLALTTGGIGSGEPVAFDAALNFTDAGSGLTAALEASAVVAADANGSVTATDVEANVTADTGGGAPVRSVVAMAERLAFDRTAETLAVDGLVTEVGGARATWQVSGSGLLTNAAVQGSVAVEAAELATLLRELAVSLPPSLAQSELGALRLSSQFAFQQEPQAVRLTEVDGEALGARVRGEVSLTEGSAVAGRVDVAEFTPNAALQALLRESAPTVDVAALGPVALAASFETNLESRRASVRDLRLTALGGSVGGNVEVIPGNGSNVIRGQLQTSRFAADALAQAFAAALPPNLSASELGMIELAATFSYDSGADTLTLDPLRAEAFGLRMNGAVAGRAVTRAATWTGTANVAQFSPQALLQRFGLPPQPTADPQALTRATVATRFTVRNDGAELDDLVLALDDTTIRGTFALQGFDAPAYRLALSVDAVDADRYLPPKARDADEGEATAGDLELPQNNTMNLDGTMQVGSLKLAGLEFADVAGRIVIGGGNLAVENARANLYGGSFAGNFRVRAAGDSPGLALDGRASGIALEPLIADLTGDEPNFSGTGSFDLNLAGQGRTVIENVQSAGGNVSFDMLEGAIKGFNLGRTLCAAYNVTQRAPAPPDLPAVTAYEFIKGSAVVSAGTATSNDMLARTSFMDLNGNGTLGLVEQSLDYELDAKLTGSIGIANCETLDRFVGGEIPFKISGTITEPSILPDFSRLVRQQLRDEVRDRLEDRLRDIFR